MKLRSDWPPFIGAHGGGRQLSKPLADEHYSLSRLSGVEMKILVCLTSSADGGCQVLFSQFLLLGTHLIWCSSHLQTFSLIKDSQEFFASSTSFPQSTWPRSQQCLSTRCQPAVQWLLILLPLRPIPDVLKPRPTLVRSL